MDSSVYPIYRQPEGPHLSEARVAAIASGQSATDTEGVHLATCRRCAAIYADLVTVETEWTRGVSAAPHDILMAGHETVTNRFRPVEAIAPTVPRWRPWQRSAIATAAILLVAVLATVRFTGGPRGVDLPAGLQASLVEGSSRGLVHPLALRADTLKAPVLRGGARAADLTSALDEVQRLHREKPESVVRVAALIGAFQALSQLQNARTYLDSALDMKPDDLLLRRLEIDQTYREGRVDEARSLLRQRLREDESDDLARLNLAILLMQDPRASSRAEGSRLARQVVERQRRGPLAERARDLLG